MKKWEYLRKTVYGKFYLVYLFKCKGKQSNRLKVRSSNIYMLEVQISNKLVKLQKLKNYFIDENS